MKNRLILLSSVMVLLLGALELTACSLSPNAKAISSAEDAIKNMLKDPDSAKFTEVSVHHTKKYGTMVCGLVNAKNSYGGYVGVKKFYVKTDSAYVKSDGTIDAIIFPTDDDIRLSENPTGELVMFEIITKIWFENCVD